MAARSRSLNHPDVEIREIDRSQISPAIVGTHALVMGFSPKGEKFNPVDLVSISDLEANFGEPTNEAERYFYYACREAINTQGRLTAIKLPFNNVLDNNYKYVGIDFKDDVLTISGDLLSVFSSSVLSATVPSLTAFGFTNFVSGEVSDVNTITVENYDVIKTSKDNTASVDATASSFDFIIVNENKAKITGLGDQDANEGLLVLVTDIYDALLVQRLISNNDGDPLDVLLGIVDGNGNVISNPNSFTKNLSATFAGASTSEDFMRQYPVIEFINDGADIDKTRAHDIGIIVARTIADPDFEGRLDIVPLESFVGSIFKDARDPSTGQSTYIVNVVNAASRFIRIFGKGEASPVSETTLLSGETDKILFFGSQTQGLIGFTPQESLPLIDGNSVVGNIRTALEKVSNVNEREIDVVVDGGLSTIAEFNDGGVAIEFDPELDVDDVDISSTTDVSVWRSVASELINFCQNVRKDCMTIIDAPRNLVLLGNNKRIRKTAPDNTFSNQIAPALRFLTGLNSSYAALYTNWNRIFDTFSGRNFYLPPTVKVGGIYITNDRVGEVFDAPAGLNRGIITEINDLSFNPRPKEEDLLYTKSFNYARQFPTEGFILWGQKTTQVRPSAFDRVNVRRLFLRLERLTAQVLKFFIFEPNNFTTRRRLVDTLNPTFQNFVTLGGIQEFRIISDESNNTSEVIDRNELRVSILIRATRTAEFIIVDFVALRSDAEVSFEELI